MKKLWVILCVCALMLCACGKTTDSDTKAETKATAAEST